VNGTGVELELGEVGELPVSACKALGLPCAAQQYITVVSSF